MTTKTGVWNLQQVRDKQLQSLWSYTGSATEPGQLWVWGSNNTGALGQNLGQGMYYSSPVQLPGTTWVDANVGTQNGSMGVKSDNTLWVWGNNYYGSLGLNAPPSEHKSSPVQLPGSWSAIIKEAGSSYQKQAIKTDGTLWSWGYQSGANTMRIIDAVTRSSPIQVGSDTNWSSGKLYDKNLYLIKTNGELWTLGQNIYGELGNNGPTGGGSWAPTSKSSPVQVPGTTWSQVGGPCAVKTDGTLWTWGNNGHGQLGHNSAGIPTRRSSPTQIPGTTWKEVTSVSSNSTMAIKTDGTMWAWGDNELGELGLNSQTDYSSPVQIPGTTWNSVEASYHNRNVIATKTDGTLWAWGENDYGRLGQNNLVNYSSPVQIGTDTSWSREVSVNGAAIKF